MSEGFGIYEVMALASIPNAITWGILAWVLKVQRTSCITLARMQTENEYEHNKRK